MKTFNNYAAQGDLLLVRANKVPAGFQKTQADGHKHIVAHSETGHHHVIDDVDVEYWTNPKDEMKAYLIVQGIIGAQMKHLRSFNTHETILIPPGIFELRRQREYTPQGWRRVED